MAGGTGREVVVHVTFDALREALTDEDLDMIRHRTFTSGRTVAIKKQTKPSTFAEDFYLEPKLTKKVKRVKGAVPQKAVPPSKRYERFIAGFMQEGATPCAETVLGFYFTLYKRYFHEEDPDWAGQNTTKAVTIVKKLADDTTEGDYRKLVNYVRKLFPMWVKRLKQGHEFPNNRPTVHSMFGGNRYFWANRNLLYKRWQEK